MTDVKKEIMEKAEKLHENTTRKAIEDISFACKRLGFTADITIAIELNHPDLPDAALIHLTGNKGNQEANIFSKAVKVITEAFDNQSPLDDLALMAALDKKGTLDELEKIVEKMDFLKMIAVTAKGMIKKNATPKEVLDELLSNMTEERPN